ncbi:MAG: hypothetical protein AB1422_16705 [bacterium]
MMFSLLSTLYFLLPYFQKEYQMALNLEEVKAGGIIAQRQKNLFSVRVRILGGNVTPEQLRKIAELSEKYGNPSSPFKKISLVLSTTYRAERLSFGTTV